jgi:cytochrome c553
MFKRLLILPVAASLAACAEAPAPSAAVSAAMPAAPAATPDRPAKLGLCVACHGEDGTSRVAGTPHLGGQDRQYLERALSDYRSGQRRHEPMTSLANSLQPGDIQALAAWYAAQPGFRAGETR